MSETLACELVSWNQVERLVDQLSNKIRRSYYKPDIVIAIARGGYVPARLLCDQLDIFDLTSIRIIHYVGTEKETQASLSMELAVDVQDMNVLVVDDVSDTGDTLRLALGHVASYRPAGIKLAVLHHKTASSVIPDYYGQKVIKWRWLTYPWAVHEDISQFLRRMSPLPFNIESARQQLQLQYGISVPRRILHTLLSDSAPP